MCLAKTTGGQVGMCSQCRWLALEGLQAVGIKGGGNSARIEEGGRPLLALLALLALLGLFSSFLVLDSLSSPPVLVSAGSRLRPFSLSRSPSLPISSRLSSSACSKNAA